MRVSLNSIKQFISFELPPVDELVTKINAQLGGVEEVIDLGARYKDVKIIKVAECGKHPNADKLSVCKIDVGTGELIQVVCGAPNVHAGMWAVWLPPGSIVPETYGTDDEFRLSARELRGEMSNGMLASARELGIGHDHDGIVEIHLSDLQGLSLQEEVELKKGAGFAEAFGLDDYIIDIENKMFTHRPDLFGQLGVAREIAGIFHKQFASPDWYINQRLQDISSVKGLSFEVFNDAKERVPRFMAVAMKDVEIRPSPLWLQCAISAMGGKPINNVVDATNYIMLITAQPTHAYDYDKIRGSKLGVRMAKNGEKLKLLNGKTYQLASEDIVIADMEGAVGLAGIMGGAGTEVSHDTKNIVLEVANFDMYTVRRSSMRHGIFTDALTRFNKGQSPFQNGYVMNQLIKMVGGSQASEIFDIGNYNDGCAFVSGENISEVHASAPHRITATFINDRLGLNLDNQEIQRLLENVEFKVEIDDKGLDVHEPFWRTDIDEPEDIVEEVGRLYGYDQLPLELPIRSVRPTTVNKQRELAKKVRQLLMRSGANEVSNYSFVHERVLKSAGQNVEDAYQLSNALSPDLQYYRLSLTPSLLDKIHANSKAGYDEFALFEIGKAHGKSVGLDEEGLPKELENISFVYTSKQTKDGAPFYSAKVFLEFLASQLNLQFSYEPLGDDSTSQATAPFEPKHSAIVSDGETGDYVGVIGEYKKTVSTGFKLSEFTAGFEIDMKTLLKLSRATSHKYQPLSRYPSVERDISLKVEAGMAYGQVHQSLESALGDSKLHIKITPLSIYQPEESTTKNVAFRILFTSYDKTLKNDEVNAILKKTTRHLEQSISAKAV